MKDYELLQKLIDESSNIVFFGGAGVSTDSGLKSFRGKDGLYSTNYNGRTPEYMLSNKCLYNETELFFDYYRNTLDCSKVVPNVTHKYLTKLEKSGKLKAIVTQNIDGLHQKAGSKNVLEIHGTTFRNYCDDCNKEYPSDYIFKSKGMKNHNILSSLITIVPPYIVSVFIPNAFMKILNFGGIFLIILSVLLPIYLYFKAIIEKPYIKILNKYALILCSIIGLIIMAFSLPTLN